VTPRQSSPNSPGRVAPSRLRHGKWAIGDGETSVPPETVADGVRLDREVSTRRRTLRSTRELDRDGEPARDPRARRANPRHKASSSQRKRATGRRERGASEAGKPRKNSSFGRSEKPRSPGCKKTRDLRVKRSDPSREANASPQAMADLAEIGPGRNGSFAGVPEPCLADGTGGCPTNQAKRPHSTGHFRELNGRPCHQGRKLRLPWRMASGSWQPAGDGWAPNASNRDESVANSNSHSCRPLWSSDRRGLHFFVRNVPSG
jgi:hypothetical protein